MRSTVLLLLVLVCVAGSAAADTIPVGGLPAELYVNPVTNTVFVRNGGTFASTITVLDLATRATQSVSFAANVAGASVDLLRNRLRVRLSTGALLELDPRTLTAAPVPVPGVYDRDGNRYFDVQTSQVDVIDAATLAVQSVPLLGSDPTAGASLFDPVSRTLQVAVREVGSGAISIQKIGGDPPQVLDSIDAGTGSIIPALAIDPYEHRTYVARPTGTGPQSYDSIRRIDWDDHSQIQLDLSTFSFALDVVGGSVWIQYPEGEFGSPGALARRSADTLLLLSGGAAMTTGSLAFDLAARRLYADDRPCCDFGSVQVFNLDGAGVNALPGSYPAPSNLRVNPATSKLYGIAAGGIAELDEPVAVPVPMPTTITPGTPAADGSVDVSFSASSAWAPVNHPVRRIYYQVDAIDGEWRSASPAGPSAQATLTGLAPGLHVIHAFAGDGQEEAEFGPAHTKVTGPIASAEVTIPAPACSNGIDDDGDGLADYPNDPGCRDAAGALENPKCDDDLDNDGDGGVDWDGGAGGAEADANCVGKPWRNNERPPSCGVGSELALVLAGLAAARRRMGRIATGC